MPARPPTTGRAKTVLVFGKGEKAKAVIASVVVQAGDFTSGSRLRTKGPGTFDPAVIRHLQEVLLPIVDGVGAALGLARKRYTISVTNLSSAAAHDVGITVNGFSADVAVLLAVLAATMRISISPSIVATGHIASPDGDIAMVRGLPVKIAAVLRDTSVQTLILPALDKNAAVDPLAPRELQRAEEAAACAKDKVRIIKANDVADLAKAALPEADLVLSSLQLSFFEVPLPEDTSSHAVGRVVNFFLELNAERFWRVLENHLLSGDMRRAKQLLRARAEHHQSRRAYPSGVGIRLWKLVCSLPPATRRMKSLLPLMPMQTCVRLGQFASAIDDEDVRLLIEASFGRCAQRVPTDRVGAARGKLKARDDSATTLDTIVSQIGADALARDVGHAIDGARATYVAKEVTTETYEEFSDVMTSFYLHLSRHTRAVPPAVDIGVVTAEALELLERTFSKEGGLASAIAEARDGTRGGIRFVLDRITDHFKHEELAKHVNLILKTALDPLSWDARVGFMRTLLERMGPHLPAHIRSQPAERYAKHYERIVHAYVESLDNLKALLHTL